MARKSRYSPEAWARRMEQNRKYQRSRTRKSAKTFRLGLEERDPRPPIEVLLERDHRIALASQQSAADIITGVPPQAYAGSYYVKASEVRNGGL